MTQSEALAEETSPAPDGFDIGPDNPAVHKSIWHDVTFTSQDGLRLYARDYPKVGGGGEVPILCLAGLTRNSKDFHDFAAKHAPRRRIIAMDYRGRGRSEHTKKWTTYSPLDEMKDAVTLLTVLGVHRVIVLGTSRGGLIAMLMAAFSPTVLHGVILNDVGPEIEPRGLLRLKGYIGQIPEPKSWHDAAHMLSQTNKGFENLTDAQWMAWAKRTYCSVNGMPVVDYDPNLTKTFPSHEDIMEGRLVNLWPQFKALSRNPVLVLRGEHSDLLTEETVEKMRDVKPDLLSQVVPDRGHVPFLDEPESEAAIDEFLLRFGTDENHA